MASSSSSSHQKQPQQQESKDENKKDDHLSRLPDHLVMLITNKLIHLKTLIRFSVVSKRYSSLVLQTDSVFLDWDVNDAAGFLGRIGLFLKNLVARVKRASTPNMMCGGSNAQKLSVMKDGFQQIKHLHFHLRGNGNLSGESNDLGLFNKWVAAFGSRFEFCHYLIASSFNQPNSIPSAASGSSNNYSLHGLFAENSESLVELLIGLLKSLPSRHDVIKKLVLGLEHRMLETFVYSDDSTGGNFIMGKEQIARLQSNEEVSSFPEDLNVSVSVVHVPTLALPKSGYTMNDVMLISAIAANQNGEVVNVMDAKENMEVGFLDDSVLKRWEVLDEAVRQILNQKKAPMYVSQIPSNSLK